ncbi:transcriptional regulator [Sutcliffiella deserti]|uniref:transcriptional regulator n=1 Tax=Sutcliffiella deserti TaxID=2875501 RepID=UPI001CBBB04B|nr:transcriptional regulator [Sutcliffiella deserti]
MTQAEQEVLYYILPFLLPVLLAQSILLFINAKKRGGYAWFWGIWGLIQFPMPTLFYLLFVVILPKKRKNKKEQN